jgi:hypothetical protein
MTKDKRKKLNFEGDNQVEVALNSIETYINMLNDKVNLLEQIVDSQKIMNLALLEILLQKNVVQKEELTHYITHYKTLIDMLKEQEISKKNSKKKEEYCSFLLNSDIYSRS